MNLINFAGFNLFRVWLFPGPHWLACLRHDGGVIRLHHALQVGNFFKVVIVLFSWLLAEYFSVAHEIETVGHCVWSLLHSSQRLLANSCCLPAKEPLIRLDIPPPLCDFGMILVQLINPSAVPCSPGCNPRWCFLPYWILQLITRFRGRRVPVWFGWLLDHPQSMSNRLYRRRPIDICILCLRNSLILPSLKRDKNEVVAAVMWSCSPSQHSVTNQSFCKKTFLGC